jgi:transposase
MLDTATQAEILRLHFSSGLSARGIAKQLGVERKTAAAVIRRREVRLRGEERARTSLLEPYYPRVHTLLEEAPGRSVVNILQNLRDAGYPGGITILREYIHTLRPREEDPAKRAFLELDFAKGEAAQVDWGEFGDVFGDGTKVHAFVMVLCWCRKMYLEFTLRQTLPALLRCFERAFTFFGRLRCREYWMDNMPTVVAERFGRLLRLTPKFLAYAGFHGFKPVLCNLGAGNEKGRVENGVKFVRNRFWPGRRFTDFDDLNRQGVTWRETYANRREHEATHKIPELMFETERDALLPLRPEPYDTDDVVSCGVSPFFRVLFEGTIYSVPWTLAGKTVTVRANDTQVRVFYATRCVASHPRCYRSGEKVENPAHAEGLREIKAGASRTWQVEAVRSFGPHATRYLDLLGAGTRSLRAEVEELLLLATVYGSPEIEKTIAELLHQGIVGVAHVERALRLHDASPKAPPPLQFPDERLDFQPPAPSLDPYDALLLDARNEPEQTPDDPHPREEQPS